MSVKKFLIICGAGLILNLAFSFAAKALNLPVFLDTTGTIFIAALGGYMPGIAVGFCTNLIKAFVDPVQMYFSTVSIMVAIFTTFLARKGFFSTLKKAIMIIPAMTIFAGILSLFIENFLNTASFLQSFKDLHLSFFSNFGSELLDKAFAVMITFALLQKVPPPIKKSFRLLGQQQAPLSEEMQQAIQEKSYLKLSLRTKLMLILMLSAFFVSFSIAAISCLLFRDATISDRIKAVDGIAAVALNEINPRGIDDYIRLGHDAEGYAETEAKLYGVKNTSVNIKYLYVYKFTEAGAQVVFDLNSADLEGDKPGTLLPFDPAIMSYKDDLLAGRPIPPIISNDSYGYLMTLYKPLYDAQGKCLCYAAVDFSMETLTEYMRTFVAHLLVLFAGCFVFIFVIGLWLVENHIIVPVNTMAYCAKTATYEDPQERNKNVELVKSLKIKTGDEIENLYSAFVRSAENLVKYLEHLQLAKIQVENMKVKVYAMDELANTDSLTGIRNKTAYATQIAKLDQMIEDGNAEFCIVMIDVNFLKKVNDTYGHERGNEYLINACRLVCSVFGEDHVYRIGGDEFVVIVSGDKVSLCRYFVKQFQMEMKRKNTNALLEPWEKVSAAVGVAFYDPAVDKDADAVFKRADKQMYENKIAMKAQRTD